RHRGGDPPDRALHRHPAGDQRAQGAAHGAGAMKAVRYAAAADGAPRLGRLEDATIVDAGPAPEIGFDASPDAWQLIASASGPEVAVAEVRLLHPCVPRKLIGIGLNYRDHAEESELDIPSVPVLFAKWPSALVGHGETIVVP